MTGHRVRRTRAAPVWATVPPSALAIGLEAVAHAEDRHAGLEQRPVELRAHPPRTPTDGPPDRMIAAGPAASISATGMVCGTISL